MFRLIYIDHTDTYRIFDSELNAEVKHQERFLKEKGHDVLCMVDYKLQFIFKRSAAYSDHREFIDDYIFDRETFQKFYPHAQAS